MLLQFIRHSLAANRYAECAEGTTSMTPAKVLAVRRMLEVAAVEFIDENAGGAGVHLCKPNKFKKSK